MKCPSAQIWRLLQMGKKNKKSKKDVHAALRELFGLDEGCKLGWKKKTLTAAFPDDDAAAGAVHPVHGATRPHDRYGCARLQNGRRGGI